VCFLNVYLESVGRNEKECWGDWEGKPGLSDVNINQKHNDKTRKWKDQHGNLNNCGKTTDKLFTQIS